ncbi:MAG: hypothetical protein DI586_05595 [Micavibrio aeruginosavorus]|uniref:O-antigen ligase-related domain-containing protein n=1 Tax=Micavibrio aeruginosavorus TaxID=349221 RepID=A0A2W5FPW0_9BACT|nr:MAG: hypothetical protein DI586_05595 [Micavibrio aeruginosavorus]
MPLADIILVFCFFLSWVRGTNIGLFLPSDESMMASIDYTTQTLQNIGLLAGLVFYVLLKNDFSFLKRSISDTLLTVVGLIVIVSLFISIDKRDSIKFLFATGVVSAPTIIYILKYGSEKFLKSLGNFVIVMAIINFLYILVMPQYAIMSGVHAGKWKGLFEHKNASGQFFALGFFIILHQFRYSFSVRSTFQLIALLISFVFVVMSKSATGVVAFAAMLLLYYFSTYMYRLYKPGERIAVFIILIVLSLLMYVLFGPWLEATFFSAIGKDATLTGRTNIWMPLLELSYERPILGYGFGMAQQPEFISQIYSQITFAPKTTHNSYLELILNIGYPATIIFVLYAVKTLVRPLSFPVYNRNIVKLRAMGTSILAVSMIMAMSSGGVFLDRSMWWLFCLTGMLLLSAQSRLEET